MKLYYAPGACSLSPHIALCEAGLTVDLVKVDLRAGTTETGAAYASINPKGYVPALQLDDGSVLTEGPAIVQFIADQSPAKHLAPAPGSADRYRLQEWLGYINSEIHKAFGPLFDKTSPDESQASARKKLDKRFKYTSAHLAEHDFLMGESFSVADGYLYVMLRWAKAMSIDTSAFPSLASFVSRIEQRAAVKEALAAEGLAAA